MNLLGSVDAGSVLGDTRHALQVLIHSQTKEARVLVKVTIHLRVAASHHFEAGRTYKFSSPHSQLQTRTFFQTHGHHETGSGISVGT